MRLFALSCRLSDGSWLEGKKGKEQPQNEAASQVERLADPWERASRDGKGMVVEDCWNKRATQAMHTGEAVHAAAPKQA